MPKQTQTAPHEDAKDQAIAAGICVADIVKVISFDESNMTVDVLPLTRYPDEDSFQTKPQVLSVPVGAILGGGFAYRPVYKAGDIGVVLYLDRDSDATIAGGQEADPNTERLHSGDDAVLSAASAPGKRKSRACRPVPYAWEPTPAQSTFPSRSPALTLRATSPSPAT